MLNNCIHNSENSVYKPLKRKTMNNLGDIDDLSSCSDEEEVRLLTKENQ